MSYLSIDNIRRTTSNSQSNPFLPNYPNLPLVPPSSTQSIPVSRGLLLKPAAIEREPATKRAANQLGYYIKQLRLCILRVKNPSLIFAKISIVKFFVNIFYDRHFFI